MKKFFLARAGTRGAGTLTFEGVLPVQSGESFDSLEKALKALEGLEDPRGFVVVEVISPRIEVKVTLDEGPDEATEKA